mgnify:CR=1 FL=1
MLAHVLHHPLDRAGDGIGAATGQRIAGVGGKWTDVARGDPQARGAGLQGAQHDAVAGQDESPQKMPLGIQGLNRHRRAHHHHDQRT